MLAMAAEFTSSSADRPARWATDYHAPVMPDEVLVFLRGRSSVLDGTLGGGGHSAALLDAGVQVAALDRDPRAVEAARRRLADYEQAGRFRPFVANYAEVDSIAGLRGERFDGILLDLGVSSHQIDDAGRGFSFRLGAPLDMRMGGDVSRTAADILNELDERDLTRILRDFADEPRAARLAREIVRRRANRPFAISDDFVGAIRAVLGARSGPAEFARLFQALRIEVNDELISLESALPVLRERLNPGGVLVVIAYHSAEDRIVKTRFREWSTGCTCPPRLPQCICGGVALGEVLTRRAVKASEREIETNRRARSARLRAWRSAA